MGNFKNDRHALYAGWVAGVGMKYGLPLLPVVDDDGNYEPLITLPVGDVILTLAIPEPPDDWEFPAG